MFAELIRALLNPVSQGSPLSKIKEGHIKAFQYVFAFPWKRERVACLVEELKRFDLVEACRPQFDRVEITFVRRCSTTEIREINDRLKEGHFSDMHIASPCAS